MGKLTRSSYNRMVLGVCGGIAEYFDMDPTLVRIGYVLISLLMVGFPGIIVYLILAVVMPER